MFMAFYNLWLSSLRIIIKNISYEKKGNKSRLDRIHRVIQAKVVFKNHFQKPP